MANNLRKFNTYSDYQSAELVKPAVSLIAATDEVYFDQKEAPVPPTPSDFCRLTLDNGETVDIEGSGELTQNVISAYSATCVSAEIGTACTSIGYRAFAYCSGLTSCTFAEGSQLTSIGEYAFRDCTSLTSITIPNSVTSIGDNAFKGCSSLTSIDIPYSLRSIGNGTFANCTSLSSIDIPDSVTSIGSDAFRDCRSLISIEIPRGVTSIGNFAFRNCYSLTSITSNAMTAPSIDVYSTFNDVGENGTLTVPSDSMGYCAWMFNTYFSQHGWEIQGVTCDSGGGSGLTVYYYIDDTSQPTQLFNGGGGSGSGSGSGSGGALPSAMIIDGTAVEVTNTYQFSSTGEHFVNYSFEDNVIPENFLHNDGGQFENVTKVEIGDAITSIGKFAFSNCSGLTSCTIGSDVTSIGGSAFTECGSLTSIEIPSGVTSIGDNAFEGCTSLTSITSNAMTAPALGNNTFSSINYNGVLTVPSDSNGYCLWIQSEIHGYWAIEGVTCE